MPDFFAPLIMVYKVLYLFAYDITGNYGVALILLSLFIYIVIFPFNSKMRRIQNEEREVQSVLLPQLEIIKKQYHGKEQYEKIKRLYHRYSYHPIYALRSAAGIILQIPFFIAARSMLYNLQEIKGVSWGIIDNLGAPDHLLAGINLLPFVMTFVTVLYAFVMPKISKKEIIQTIIIGVVFLIILYPAPSALLIFWICNLLWSLFHCFLFDRLQWFNDSIERIGDFFSKNELAFHIIFALSLTAGLFVPLEIYIKNADQLWFSIKDVIKYFVADTVQYFAVLLLVYIACLRKRVRGIYLSVLLGLLLGIFLQSYIISLDYGTFNGNEIEWGKYTREGLINTFIWLFCLGETFVNFKRLKFDLDRIKKYVKPIALCIVAIQCVALFLSLKNNPLPESAYETKKTINIFTTKNMFNVSSQNNIIVLLLDMFDASVFEEIVKKDPEIINELKGFTFYPDTTSVFGLSYTSIPQILTGKIYYNDMSRSQYIEQAWDNNQYYADLKKNNYDIGIFTTEDIASPDAPISNLLYENIIVDRDAVNNSLKPLIMFRMAPHYAKKLFYEYNPDSQLYLLANKQIQAYKEDDREFYLRLKRGLSFQEGSNCFRFYHLTGSHYPYVLDRNMEYIKQGVRGNIYEQSVGKLQIVIEYIRQLKQRGVFENSTFVIMADHGYHNRVGSRPLLCIKQPGNKSTAMKVSGEAISFSDFMPMLLQRFYGERNYTKPDRKFYLQQERDFVEYEIVGNAKDLSSWNKIRILGSWYKKQANTYKLGKEIDCTDKNWDFETFQGTGWHEKPESFGTWSAGPESTLVFNLDNYSKDKDLKFSFNAITYLSDLSYRTARFYVNDVFITDIILDNKTYEFSFIIPATIVVNNSLKIRYTIDHSGLAIRDSGAITDLGILWMKLKIEEE